MQDTLPNVQADLIDIPSLERLATSNPSTHKPRILLLYGSTRERSFSRLVTQEAARLLEEFGAETRIFDPSGLPLPDDAPDSHPKVLELRELMQWSEGQVWCSPERHGAMSAVFKAQIDWVPLAIGAVRPTQRQNLGSNAGLRRLPVVQRGQPVARSGALDANVHHPKSILGRQGVH